MPAGGEPCVAIQRIAAELRASRGEDALYVFLRIHHCICLKAASSPAEPIRHLNEHFEQFCVRRIENVRQARVLIGDLSDRWKRALEAYLKDASDFAGVLPRLAIAHIADDLPDALLKSQEAGVNVTRAMFNAVLDDILNCVDEAYSRPPLSLSLKAAFLQKLGEFSGAERFVLSELRAFAWGRAEERARLRERLRQLRPR
ncbi:MAG TPA: hypothetical protein VEG64_10540 [Candidatus Sulfotelmatobacter sp.]|nr:hypothetical protein [Candidatus Sulfotelmatobacter sp.]